jgi:hypothetical protein
MEPTKDIAIVVEYNSDPTKMIDDHDSEQVYLTEINERRFTDVFEAIKFLTQCNSPITKIDQLLPLGKKPKGFKFILPEHNIKIKHQANDALDSLFDLDAEDWG